MFDQLFEKKWTMWVVSIVMAFAIWVQVFAQSDAPVTHVVDDVTVTTRNQSQDVIIMGIEPTAVDVTVRANRQVIDSLSRDQFSASVDLLANRSGNYNVDVTVPRGVELVGVDPEVVELELEAVVEKLVPVEVQQSGEPEEGFEVKEVEPRLTQVRLRGPKSAVERAAAVSGAVNTTGVENDLTRQMALQPVDADGANLADINVIPSSIPVTVAIRPVIESKELPVEAVVEGEPAAGFAIGEVQVEPQRIAVEGPVNVLDEMEQAATQVLSIDGAEETVTMDVGLNLPQGVEAEVGTVRVTIEVAAEGAGDSEEES